MFGEACSSLERLKNQPVRLLTCTCMCDIHYVHVNVVHVYNVRSMCVHVLVASSPGPSQFFNVAC